MASQLLSKEVHQVVNKGLQKSQPQKRQWNEHSDYDKEATVLISFWM